MIKAIIGERPNEYLIDWADDPITGEKFKPDWVSGQSVLQINLIGFAMLRGAACTSCLA